MESDQRGMDGDGDDGQVEVVEHDGHVVVEAAAGLEVQAQQPAADQGHGTDVPQPAERDAPETLDLDFS